MDQPFFIVYFPYLSMRNVSEVDFGFAKVWNFSLKKDEYISDTATKEKLGRIFSCYESYGNSIMDQIGVLSIGDIDFRQLNDNDYIIVKQVKLILFLCFLSKNNTMTHNSNSGHDMATAENFDVIFQNFKLDDDHVSELTGHIITFNIGGYILDQTKYNRPSYVPKPRFNIDTELKEHLLILKDKKPLVFKRVMDATEIFFQSYYNTPSLSRYARILLQMSAFEILLKIPEDRQRKVFREKIKEISVHEEDQLERYNIRGRRGIVVRGRFTFKEIWADKFYLLRNSIIHGDILKEEDFIFKDSQFHSDIALLFFILAIKKQIEKSLRTNQFSCNYEINWRSWTDYVSQAEPVERSGFDYNLSYRRAWRQMLDRLE